MGIQEKLDEMKSPPNLNDMETLDLDVGDSVVGTVIGYRVAKTRYGPAPIVQLDLGGGQEPVAFWLSATVLRTCFDRERPVPGDEIGIKRFEDNVEPTYKRYAVICEKGDGDRSYRLPPFLKEDAAPEKATPKAVGPGVGDEIPPIGDDDIPF